MSYYIYVTIWNVYEIICNLYVTYIYNRYAAYIYIYVCMSVIHIYIYIYM